MKENVLLRLLLVIGLIVPMQLGCRQGPSTGNVNGQVTLDGSPLPNATVTFYPEEGRGSVARTDGNGNYELDFTKDIGGAIVGKHKVTISTRLESEESRQIDYDDATPGKARESSGGRPETMPDHYRLKAKTKLSAEVKSGNNKIDFALKSGEDD